MEPPRISVVVPCLNQGAFLDQALRSIFAQDYANVEVIVADGGSTDGGIKIIRSHQDRIARWKSAPDDGQSAAINWGVGQSTGEIVCWLNSDDLFCEGALRRVGAAATRHPECGLYIGNGLISDEATGLVRAYCPHPLSFNRHALAFGGPYVHQPSTFFRRAAWVGAGGLDETLDFCMDWDVIIRASATTRVLLINEHLAITRVHPAAKTASGGLTRAAEVVRVARQHSGQALSLGAAVVMLDTILDSEESGRFGFDAFRHLFWVRRHVGRALSRLTGSPDHFPVESDADVQFDNSADLPRGVRPRARGRSAALRRAGMATVKTLACVVVFLVLRCAVAARLMSPQRACAAVRSWRRVWIRNSFRSLRLRAAT
jgi:hypothetical protein